jgi:hypothetical protein
MSTVRLYDPKTRASREIPTDELGPECRRFFVPEFGGEVFINWDGMHACLAATADLFVHGPLSDVQKEFVALFASAFKDVYPRTPEQWEEGFRRQEEVDQEIMRWRCIGVTFLHFTASPGYTLAEKVDIFRIVVKCSFCGMDAGISCADLNSLSHDDALFMRDEIAAFIGRKKGHME